MNKTTDNEIPITLGDVHNELLRARNALYDLLEQNPQYTIGRKHLIVLATKQISQAIANITK